MHMILVSPLIHNIDTDLIVYNPTKQPATPPILVPSTSSTHTINKKKIG